MKKKKQNVKTSKADVKKAMDAIKASKDSKSSKMKQMFDLGLDVKQIADIMQVRYNFVYNVVSNYVRMNDIKVVQVKKQSRKDDIVKLYKTGKTNVEISKALKCNYNYVFKVVKEYREDHPMEAKA